MTEPKIVADKIVRHFGAVKALDGVSLSVEAGTIYGLLGPNGAGKTTLIRVLSTLLKPDSGSGLVAGIDVVADPHGARKSLGLAGQTAAVDEFLTGRENLEMVGHLYHLPSRDVRARAEEVLHRINLTESADRPVSTYSGGMRRRLDLAASLVGRPEVLFLDEPTTGLHFADVEMLLKMLGSLVDMGNTVVIIEHHLDVIKTADHVIDLGPEGGPGGGQIVAQGPPSAIAEVEASHTGRALRGVLMR